MSESVFSATMTLDGAPFLATSAKVAQATSLTEAQLKRLDAQVLVITNALRPLANISSLVQKQFDAVRGSTTALTAANAPAQGALSATAAALAGLNGERATVGLSRTALMLANITSQAATAADAIGGLNQDIEGTSAAEGEAAGQEKGEAETPEAPEGHAGHNVAEAASVAAGAHAGSGQQVEELAKVEKEEEKVEAETKHVAEAMDHLSDALTHNAGEAGHQAKATHEAGAEAKKTAGEAKKAGDEVKHAGDQIEKAGHQSEHTKKELGELGRGFEGLGEGVRKTAEIIRDVLVAMPEVAALVGILAGVGEMVAKIREAFSYGDKLSALSRQTGETATTIAQLRRTFEYFDVSADEVGHTLFMLQKSLGGVSEAGEPTAQAFARLHLNMAELKKMDAGQQFGVIMQALQKLPDQATKSAIAMQIFGRSAMEVQSILNADPAGFAQSMQDAAEYAQVMGQNAAAFEDIERKFFVFREQIETLFARIAAGLVPAVQKLLDLVNQIDFSKWGTAITNVMGVITNAIGNGDIGKIFGLTLELAAVDAMQTITGLFIGVAQAFNAAFSAIFSASFWSSLAVGFKGVAEAFGAAILNALRDPINALQSAIEYPIALQNAKNDAKADTQDLQSDSDRLDKLREKYIAKGYANPAVQEVDAFNGQKTDKGVMHDEMNRLLDAIKADNKRVGDDTAIQGMSLSEFQKAHAANDPTLFGKNAQQLQGQSNRDVAAAAPALDRLKSITDAFWEGLKKAQQAGAPGGMFDTSSIQAQLDALIKKNLPATSPETGNRPIGAASPMMPNLTYKPPEGDRLSKMGLFIGGSTATPGLTEARRTAAATERTAKGVERIINVSGGRPGQTAAVYN